MEINGVPVREVVSSAVAAWFWTNEDGAEYSITWLRYTAQMLFGVRVKGQEAWSTTRMHMRFDNQAKTIDGARAVVRAFLAAGTEDR